MKVNKEFIFRFFLLIISLGIILFNAYQIYQLINPIINEFISFGNLNLLKNLNLDISLNLYFIIFGYILYFISIKWKNSFKHLSKVLISLSLVFLSFSIVLFVININTSEITNSIQPSIDYTLVNGVELALTTLIDKQNGGKINLTLSKNSSIKSLYVKNLTNSQSIYFLNSLNISNLENNLIISKIIISSIYDKLDKTNSNLKNIAIPISTINSQIISSNYDINVISGMNLEILNLIPINQQAYLNILISNSQKNKEFVIGKLENKSLNLIWDNFNLNNNISINTKNITINFLLSILNTQLKNNSFKSSIPLSSISSLIPMDLKLNLNQDFLSKNISKRIRILNQFRNDCNILKNNYSTYYLNFCNIIKLSNYEYFLKNIENISIENNFNISKNILNNSKKFNSIPKVNRYIQDKSFPYLYWLLGYFFLISLSFFSLKYHFKFNKKEYTLLLLCGKFSKMIVIKLIPFVFITILFYYLISQNILINFIGSFLNNQTSNLLNILIQTPIYKLLIYIFYLIMLLNLCYFIFILMFYLLFKFNKKIVFSSISIKFKKILGKL